MQRSAAGPLRTLLVHAKPRQSWSEPSYGPDGSSVTPSLFGLQPDPRTPSIAKVVAAAVAAYALSPIDLIPDFIPVLGYLDDLLIVPAGIALAVRLIPAGLMGDFRRKADERAGRPRSAVVATVIVLIWLLSLAALGFWALRHFRQSPMPDAMNARPRPFSARSVSGSARAPARRSAQILRRGIALA